MLTWYVEFDVALLVIVGGIGLLSFQFRKYRWLGRATMPVFALMGVVAVAIRVPRTIPAFITAGIAIMLICCCTIREPA